MRQPVAGEDVAELAIAAGEGETIDAAGPEVYELRRARAHGRAWPSAGAHESCVHRPALGLGLTAIANRFLRDVVVTREELGALAAGLLRLERAPTWPEELRRLGRASGPQLGTRYVSELERNFRSYAPL